MENRTGLRTDHGLQIIWLRHHIRTFKDQSRVLKNIKEHNLKKKNPLYIH